jgi:uncharacterized protein YjbI with pentapeptide repeats
MSKEIYYFEGINNKHAGKLPKEIKIPATEKDIKDYIGYRQDHSQLKSVFLSFMKQEPNIESEMARGSFNDFVKYRYLTSKFPKGYEINSIDFRADISKLDLSNNIDFSNGDFSNIYALHTNFSNADLHLASFKNAALINATFHRTDMAYADFSGANLGYAIIEDATGGCIVDANTSNVGMIGKLETIEGFPSVDEIRDKFNTLKKNVEEKASNFTEAAKASAKGYVVDPAFTLLKGIEGGVFGGFTGFAVSNLAMATIMPVTVPALIFNISLIGAGSGFLEGARYYTNSDSSYILKVKNLRDYIMLSRECALKESEGNKISKALIFSDKQLSDNEAYWEMDKEVEKILLQYESTISLKVLYTASELENICNEFEEIIPEIEAKASILLEGENANLQLTVIEDYIPKEQEIIVQAGEVKDVISTEEFVII